MAMSNCLGPTAINMNPVMGELHSEAILIPESASGADRHLVRPSRVVGLMSCK